MNHPGCPYLRFKILNFVGLIASGDFYCIDDVVYYLSFPKGKSLTKQRAHCYIHPKSYYSFFGSSFIPSFFSFNFPLEKLKGRKRSF